MTTRDPTPQAATWGKGGDGTWIQTFLVPLALTLFAPVFILALWMAANYHEGSLMALITAGRDTWLAELPLPTSTAATMAGLWAVFQLVLLLALPGRMHEGPITESGYRPRYKLNGAVAWCVTHGAWFGMSYGLGWFDPAIIFNHFGALLATMNLFALVFCGFLYIKGVVSPSTPDAVPTGMHVFDFYWGVELHPHLFGVSLKQLFNCRIAMMGWSIILLSFAEAQIQRHGELSSGMLVCVGLQMIYILKFFVWERGYFHSLDVMHDRFGFYICWGVCVWLPSLYTIAALFIVDHPSHIAPPYAWLLGLAGVTALLINYQADAQRQRVRETGGDTTVWGRPPEMIRARYRTTDGEEREGLLLVSGWWGAARHFHYLPEWLLAVAWTASAGFGYLLPWAYPIFLLILLVDRANRDDSRCAKKYGDHWSEYRRRVPWKIVPRVY